jgi:hypothetical protein
MPTPDYAVAGRGASGPHDAGRTIRQPPTAMRARLTFHLFNPKIRPVGIEFEEFLEAAAKAGCVNAIRNR